MEGTPIFSKETRVGLVLYGGVSLAIYMNGVSREFFEAVRGRGVYKLIKALTDSDVIVDVVSGTSAGGVNGILLSYALANSDDEKVMEFSEYANLWIQSGSLEKLFGNPGQGQDKDPIRRSQSIFDGKYYRDQLEAAFSEKTSSPHDNEWPSSMAELDLFITATDLDGRVSRIPDKAGSIIDVKDHRTVFHLQHRKDQLRELNAPFKPSEVTRKSLAKLASITSCFPVAFPVVNVSLRPDQSEREDSRLVAWGNLFNRVEKNKDGNHRLSFVDGGVLSNRPFSLTIDAIYARSAYRKVVRKLFYVDPNPEVFPDKPETQENYWAQHPIKVAISSKIDIPNYQSISSDLKRIQIENQHVLRRQQLRKRVQDLDNQEFLQLVKNTRSDNAYLKLEETSYLQSRLFGHLESSLRALRNHLEPQDCQNDEYLQAANEMLSTRVLTQIVEENDHLPHFKRDIEPWDVDYYIRKHWYIIGMLGSSATEIQNKEVETAQMQYRERHYGKEEPGLTDRERAESRRKRRAEQEENRRQFLSLRYLSYCLSWQLDLLQILKEGREKLLKGYELTDVIDLAYTDPSDQFDHFYGFMSAFNSTIYSDPEGLAALKNLYDYVDSLPKASIPSNLNWSLISSLLPERHQKPENLFALIYKIPLAEYLTEARLDQMDLRVQVAKKQQESESNAMEHFPSLLEKIDAQSRHFFEQEYNALNPQGRTHVERIRNVFLHFDVIDRLLYPFEALSGVSSRNVVDVIRVSPEDTQHGYGKGRTLRDKLRGYELNAFGGFFKDPWRSNDLLWGRLDGLDRLVSGLLTPEAIKEFPLFFFRELHEKDSDEPLAQSLETFIHGCLPWMSVDEKKDIMEYLLDILTGTSHQTHVQNHPRHQAFLEALIQAGQREILMEKKSGGSSGTLDQDLDLLEKDLTLFSQQDTRALADAISDLRRQKTALSINRTMPEASFTQFDDAFRHYQTEKQRPGIYRTSRALSPSKGINFGWLLFHRPRKFNWMVKWLVEKVLSIRIEALNQPQKVLLIVLLGMALPLTGMVIILFGKLLRLNRSKPPH